MAKELIKVLALDHIMLDQRLQMRVSVDPQDIEELAEALAAKRAKKQELVLDGELPAVFSNGGVTWLADGFKRHAAYGRIGEKRMKCSVRPGTFLDALRHALGANAKHGVKRTAADARNAVRVALMTPEFDELTQQDIADLTRTSRWLVNEVLDETRCDPKLASGCRRLQPDTKVRGRDGKVQTASKSKPDKEHPPARDDGRPWQDGPQTSPPDGPEPDIDSQNDTPAVKPAEWRTHPLTRLTECRVPSSTIWYLTERATGPDGGPIRNLGDLAAALDRAHDLGLATMHGRVADFVQQLRGEAPAHAEPEPADESPPKRRRQTTKGEPLYDALGAPVPDHLRDVFGDPWLHDLLEKAGRWHGEMQSRSIAASLSGKASAYGYLRAHDALKQLAAAIDSVEEFAATVRAGIFHAVHPRGGGRGARTAGTSARSPSGAGRSWSRRDAGREDSLLQGRSGSQPPQRLIPQSGALRPGRGKGYRVTCNTYRGTPRCSTRYPLNCPDIGPPRRPAGGDAGRIA